MRKLAVALVLFVGVLSFSACARAAPDQGAEVSPSGEAKVRVENRNYLDHNIYVLRGAQRIRLGTVTGNSTATFTIPASLIHGTTPLSFIADPIGASRTPVSNEIPVLPGDTVELIIPA